MFENFQCPLPVHPVIFSHFCTFFHQERLKDQAKSESQDATNVSSSGISLEGKKKDLTKELVTTLGQVWVGESHQPLCIPTNSAKVVTGKTDKNTKRLACMVKSCDSSNLPLGVVVNRTMVTPNKSKCVPMLLMNTNSFNVWIQQPLLAANVVEAEHCPWDYQSFLSHDGNEVKVTFHPIPTQEVQEEILSQSVSQESSEGSKDQPGSKEGSEKSEFGP